MKTVEELNTIADKRLNNFINEFRRENNKRLVRGVADAVMCLSKAENNEEELEALKDIKQYLNDISLQLSLYEHYWASARARYCTFMNYIEDVNQALRVSENV